MRNRLCECFTEIDPDIEEWNDYTGHDQWNAVYTIQLGELIDAGVFSWDYDLLNWESAAFDSAQYERVCNYFIERFYYREISVEPFDEWARMLHSRLVYELMPKYRILYDEAAQEWSIKTGGREYGNSTDTSTQTLTDVLTTSSNESGNSDNYYKGRDIGSDYPETLLSGNSDYITTGKDTEDERIIEDERTKTGSENRSKNGSETKTNRYEKDKDVSTLEYVEAANAYADFFGRIDKRLLDELETFFISMYTTNVNATW